MKQLLSIAVVLCFMAQWGNAQWNHSTRSLSSFNYDFTTSIDPYVDLTGATSINNGEIWDQPEYIVPMGFPFILNGHAVTSFHFNGSGSIMASNTPVPFVVAEIFPFESDLIDRGALGSTSLSPISYIIEGNPGSRIQKIEFKNAGSYYEMDVQGTLNMYVNFQCWLFEGSNTIEFHYGPSSISDPLLFYGGGNGPESGLTDYDEFDDLYSNGHFLIGSSSNPFLSEDLGFLNGTPVAGTVYRFTHLPPLSITVTGVNSVSFCQPNGSAQVVAIGGTFPYSYLWSTGATTSSIDNLDAGIYHITVEDADGSTVADSITIFNAAPMTIHIISTDETALDANDGTATAFPIGGLAPYTYAWSNGATTSILTGLAPGMYDVTVTDASGCTVEQSANINAYVCSTLTLEVSIVNAACFGLCNGSINVVQVGQGTAPYSFYWNEGSTTPSIDSLCAAEYAVTVVDAKGCSASENYQVIQPTLLSVNAGSTNESGQNQNDGTAWATPTGGTPPYTYAWSNGSTDSLITNLVPGEYIVTITDGSGCEAEDSIEVLDHTVSIPAISGWKLNIYPNPANDFIYVKGIDANEYEIRLLATSGQVIKLWKNTSTLNVHDVVPGLYELKILSGTNSIIKPLIILR